jgi:hypothetical protein
VVRHAPPPDPLSYLVKSQTVLSVEIRPQPAELFELPEGAVLMDR